MINKRRRDAAAAKRILKTLEEIKEKAKQSKKDYKNRMKEHRANILHPDSIAMANLQWKPEFLSPPSAKPSSRVLEEMVIPKFVGSPVYVEVEVREPPQQDEAPETFLSNTIHTTHLTQDYENLDESVIIKSLNPPLEETHLSTGGERQVGGARRGSGGAVGGWSHAGRRGGGGEVVKKNTDGLIKKTLKSGSHV
jgi:hypothetical protein